MNDKTTNRIVVNISNREMIKKIGILSAQMHIPRNDIITIAVSKFLMEVPVNE